MNYTAEIAAIKKANDLDFIDLQSYEIKVIQGKGKLEPYDEYIIKKRLDKIKAINRLIDIVNEVQADTVFDSKEFIINELRRNVKFIDELINLNQHLESTIKIKSDNMLKDWLASDSVVRVINSKRDFRNEILDNITGLLDAYFNQEIIPSDLYESHNTLKNIFRDILSQINLYRRAKKQ